MMAADIFNRWLVIDWSTGRNSWSGSLSDDAHRFLLLTPNGPQWMADASSLDAQPDGFVLVMFVKRRASPINHSVINLDRLLNGQRQCPVWCHYGGAIQLAGLQQRWDGMLGIDAKLREDLTGCLPQSHRFPMPFSDKGRLDWMHEWRVIKRISRENPVEGWGSMIDCLNGAWRRATATIPAEDEPALPAHFLLRYNACVRVEQALKGSLDEARTIARRLRFDQLANDESQCVPQAKFSAVARALRKADEADPRQEHTSLLSDALKEFFNATRPPGQVTGPRINVASHANYVILRHHGAVGDELPDVFSATLMHASLGSAMQLPTPPEWIAAFQPDPRDAFREASQFLRSNMLDSTRPTIVLVDEVDISLFSTNAPTWSGLIAMLVLAFPENHFLFMSILDSTDHPDWSWLVGTYGPEVVPHSRGTPLFDGHGLRTWLRRALPREPTDDERDDDSSDKPAAEQPDRVAVVLEDERDFRNFEALMVYRQDIRVHAIESWREARELLAGEGPLMPDKSKGFELSIEDLYLSYPDGDGKQLSNLDEREKQLPGLGLSHPVHRRFVSAGYRNCAEQVAYLKQLRQRELERTNQAVGESQQFVYKPAPGLYALWSKLGSHPLFSDRNAGCRRDILQFWLSLLWDAVRLFPQIPACPADDKHDHSAPGKIIEIARSLLDGIVTDAARSGELLNAVVGAVRAREALKLIGGAAPTLSLEALNLKHVCETRAACQFVGVEYRLAMTDLQRNLRQDLARLTPWVHASRRRAFVMNGEARVLNSVIAVLDEFGHFDAAEGCRARMTTLYRLVEMQNDLKSRSYLRMLMWPGTMYIDFASRSLGHYLVAFGLSIALFSGIFYLHADGMPWITAMDTTLDAMLTFRLPHHDAVKYPVEAIHHHCMRIAGYAASLFGVMNFGLLVNYIYTKLRRR